VGPRKKAAKKNVLEKFLGVVDWLERCDYREPSTGTCRGGIWPMGEKAGVKRVRKWVELSGLDARLHGGSNGCSLRGEHLPSEGRGELVPQGGTDQEWDAGT